MRIRKRDTISRPFAGMYLAMYGLWAYLACVSHGYTRAAWLVLAVIGIYPTFTITRSGITQEPRRPTTSDAR